MLTLALTFLLVALAYFLVTTTVDLAPLNNVTSSTLRERATEAAINGPIMLVPAVLVLLAAQFDLAVLALLGGALEFVVVTAGLLLWWLPYLTGVSVPWATAGTEDTWEQLHARVYETTIIILPRRGDRPRPNLEHMILHLLMTVGAVFAFAYAAGIA